jgi:hypothetical protein
MSTNKNQSGVWTRVLHSLSPTAFSFLPPRRHSANCFLVPVVQVTSASVSQPPLHSARRDPDGVAQFFSSIFFRYGSQGRLHAPIIYKILAPTSTPLR